MYESRDRAKLLTKNQMCICRCPDWCYEGYQIGTWNGEAFEYDADPNGGFDQHVIAFLPLNKDGKPTKLKEIHRCCPNCGAENTITESVNKHTCRYCEGESDNEY